MFITYMQTQLSLTFKNKNPENSDNSVVYISMGVLEL